MTTIAQYYARVNAAWGRDLVQVARVGHRLEGVANPEPDEAVKAAAKLWRFVTGRSCPILIQTTTGNRDTWVVGGVLKVNYEKGWYELVHMMSHYLLQKVSVAKPHSKDHARLELRMVKEVVKRGWLDGSLKAKAKPAPVAKAVDVKAVKLERTEAAIARWEAKLRRAENALKKLNRRRRYYTKTGATSHAVGTLH